MLYLHYLYAQFFMPADSCSVFQVYSKGSPRCAQFIEYWKQISMFLHSDLPAILFVACFGRKANKFRHIMKKIQPIKG